MMIVFYLLAAGFGCLGLWEGLGESDYQRMTICLFAALLFYLAARTAV